MSKYAKGLIETYYTKTLQQAQVKDFLVLSLIGIDGILNNQIRSTLRQKGIRVLVVKNSLFIGALKNLHMERAAGLFAGPCAVAFGAESLVDVAREVVEVKKKVEALQIKGGYLDGTILDAAAAVALAKMPTLKELKGQVSATISGPARVLSGAIGGMGGVVAGCIKSLVEKLEKQAA